MSDDDEGLHSNGIPALPTEILIDVLERASVADLQACSNSSRRMRRAADSALKPLRRRLSQEGLEYVPHTAPTVATATSLLSALDDRARNWHEWRSTSRLNIPYPGARVQFLMGNGFMVLCPSIRTSPWTLKVIQLPHPSPELENEHVEEMHETSALSSLCDFAIDSAQDLVITAEFVLDQENYHTNSRMYLRPLSMKTLEKHPLMQCESDKLEARILADHTLSSSRPNLHIAGDYVALFVGPLLIFNWKTGQTHCIAQPTSHHSAAHTFITPTALVVLLHTDQDSPIIFKLYRLISHDAGSSTSERWTHAATFEMPLLHQQVNDFHIWASPYTDPPAQFIQRHTPRVRSKLKAGTGLVVIRLRGWDNENNTSTANLCVFRKEVFLRDPESFGVPVPTTRNPSTTRARRLSSASQGSLSDAKDVDDDSDCNPYIIPWEKWSHGVTRFITDRRFVTARGVTSSCDGFKLVTMTAGTEHPFGGSYTGKVAILDFNPDSVNSALATVAKQNEFDYSPSKSEIPVELNPDWKFSIREDDEDDSNSSTGNEYRGSTLPTRIKKRVVTEESSIEAKQLFKQAVQSSLPFYEVIQGFDSVEVCELRVDQDRLYVAKKNGEGAGIIVHCF